MLLQSLISAVSLAVAVQAQAVTYPDNVFSPCANVRTRLEWRQLSEPQRQEYLNAVNCLRRSGTFARFAETHRAASNNNWAHASPIFLPWHRIFIGLFEHALRSSCQYSAPLPYWDWSLDNSNALAQSPVLQAVGGNGNPQSQSCVTTGPFADQNEATCIKRNFVTNRGPEASGNMAWSWLEMQSDLTTSTSYSTFVSTLESGGHAAIHSFIGGAGGHMSSLQTSALDPVFWLHHTNVDRWWAEWQAARQGRMTEYNGGNATPQDLMRYGGLRTDAPVSLGLRHGAGTHQLTCFDYGAPVRQAPTTPRPAASGLTGSSTGDGSEESAGLLPRPSGSFRDQGTSNLAEPSESSEAPNLAISAPHPATPEEVLARMDCKGSCVDAHRTLEAEQAEFIEFVNAANWTSEALSSPTYGGEVVSFTDEEYMKLKEDAYKLIIQSPIYKKRVGDSEPTRR
ncbi:hypothetical protein DFS34DRAFT_184248 [Phlyctochytrium arcticum]|nr:hypothetical protein DFS34DRAFT_184248 [Phlyctochytrium arcticum]